MKSPGKIQRVEIKDVWPHEAVDFTPWLQDNIDALNDALDLKLQNPEREQSTGNFSVDIVAEDENGDAVAIENQLGKSDHDHLGKLITYLSAFDAKTGIWIVGDARPEHVKAVGWLNESSPANFYLVKLEAIRIGESDPAALFTRITGPSVESRMVGAKKKEMADRDVIRQKYWATLLERSKKKTRLFSSNLPAQGKFISTKSGVAALAWAYMVEKHQTGVVLYIDGGPDSDEKNQSILHQLMQEQSAVDDEFDCAVVWDPMDGSRACRITMTLDLGGYEDEEQWPEIQDATIDAMIRFEKALKPHIRKLS